MTQPIYYTCIGKGGEYVRLGEAIGAGTSKPQRVEVYRDTKTHQLFFRTQEDFDARMEEIPPKCVCCGATENLFDDGWCGWRCSSGDCLSY